MKTKNNFLKSILVVIIALLILLLSHVVMIFVFLFKANSSGEMGQFGMVSYIDELIKNPAFSQKATLLYGVVALVIFGIWYYKAFVVPFANVEKKQPDGFSIHTVFSLFFVAFGAQILINYLVNTLKGAAPIFRKSADTMLQSAGIEENSLILILYLVILAPIVEEFIFRGLVYRYSRLSIALVPALIWQAIAFGVMHLSLVQGIYAFFAGIMLAYISIKGRGIKYSIVCHIFFNFLGTMFGELFTGMLILAKPVALVLGAFLLIFGLWIFATDFQTNKPKAHVHEEKHYDDEPEYYDEETEEQKTYHRRRQEQYELDYDYEKHGEYYDR